MFLVYICTCDISPNTRAIFTDSSGTVSFSTQSYFLPLGRIDRKIEFPLPDEKTKRRIFNIHTSRMTLAEDVDLTEYIMAKDDLSGADIKVSVPSI